MLYLGLPAADIIGHPAQPFALSHFTWQEDRLLIVCYHRAGKVLQLSTRRLLKRAGNLKVASPWRAK
jgi:hypothetical protein